MSPDELSAMLIKHRLIRKMSLINPNNLIKDLNQIEINELEEKKEDYRITNLRVRRHFINQILYLKGLNREVANEMYILKMGKILDRNLNNPNMKINKETVVNALRSSFTNNTFLNKLKKQSAQIENELKRLGINYE